MINAGWFKALILLLLCLATFLFFKFHDRYETIGPELLANSRFEHGLAEWQYSRDNAPTVENGTDMAVLRSTTPSTLVHLSQRVTEPTRFELLELSADLKTLKVRRGDKHWKSARIVLLAYDHAGKAIYYLPHTVVELDGDSDWEHYQRVFRIDEGTHEIRISAQLMQATGAMWVKNLSLRPVAEIKEFLRYRAILLTLWIAVAAWIFISLVRARNVTSGISLMAVIALGILVGVLLTGHAKKSIDRSLPAVLMPTEQASSQSAPPTGSALRISTSNESGVNIYKVGHFGMFFLLALVAFRDKKKDAALSPLLGYLLLFAFATETVQLFSEGREMRFKDFLIDSAGIAGGIAAARLLKLFRAL